MMTGVCTLAKKTRLKIIEMDLMTETIISLLNTCLVDPSNEIFNLNYIYKYVLSSQYMFISWAQIIKIYFILFTFHWSETKWGHEHFVTLQLIKLLIQLLPHYRFSYRKRFILIMNFLLSKTCLHTIKNPEFRYFRLGSITLIKIDYKSQLKKYFISFVNWIYSTFNNVEIFLWRFGQFGKRKES